MQFITSTFLVMAKTNNHLVIMAMSTADRPKQFIDVLGVGKSLLQLTVERFGNLIKPENIWVVTNQHYAAIVKEQLPDMPESNILCEPCRRNTAPCIAYVSWRIKSKDPKANIVVTPSDHIVTDTAEFQRVIKECMVFTSETDAIVTLGMKPNRPETGYGYIQADLSISSLRNKEIYRVDSPCAGIFIWNVSTIVNAFRVYQPSMARLFESLLPVYGKKKEQEEINRLFPECENISVDYAIMEKAEEIFVCPADFGWSDLGTWGSLHEQSKKDLYGNVCIGPEINIFESHNCIVHTTQEKKVVIQGLDGYIIAENDDTLLICKLSEEQRIKNFSGNN